MAKTVKDTVEDVDGKWAIATLPKKENNISSMGGSNLTIFDYSKKKMTQPNLSNLWHVLKIN